MQKDCPTHYVRARLHLLFTQLLESLIRLHVRSFHFGVTPASLERQTAELHPLWCDWLSSIQNTGGRKLQAAAYDILPWGRCRKAVLGV